MIGRAITSILSGTPAEYVISKLVEGEGKKYRTPKFVQHCVTALVNDKGYSKDKAFAICYAQRNKGRERGKHYEVKHGKEHTSSKRKEFEQAIDYKGVN